MTKNYTKNSISQNYTRNLVRGNVTGNLSINSALRFANIYGSEDRLSVLKKIQKEKIFRFWWYLIFSIAAVVSLFFFPSSYLSVIEVFVLMLNIDLVSRGKVIGIYIGILDCIFYIAICSMSGLWGEVIKMAIINIPLNIVAIVNWTKNLKKQSGGSEQTIEIKKLTKKSYIVCISAFVVSGVAGYFFLKFLNTTSLIISSVSFAIGIISKVLNGQRYMEAYVVSIIGNIISLALWFSIALSGSADAPVQIIMALANLSNGIYSYFLWKDMYRKRKVNGGKLLAKRQVKINRVIKLRRTYKNLYWDKQVDISKNS